MDMNSRLPYDLAPTVSYFQFELKCKTQSTNS